MRRIAPKGAFLLRGQYSSVYEVIRPNGRGKLL